jgi:hypothetical protein
VFAPALGLGIASLGELVDVRIDGTPEPAEVCSRLGAVAPEGFHIEDVVRLEPGEPGLNKVLEVADYVALVPPEMVAGGLCVDAPRPIARSHKGVTKMIDVARYLVAARVLREGEAAPLRARLEWPEGAVVWSRVRLMGMAPVEGEAETNAQGSAKASEVLESLLGAAPPENVRYARAALWAGTRHRASGVEAPPGTEQGEESSALIRRDETTPKGATLAVNL